MKTRSRSFCRRSLLALALAGLVLPAPAGTYKHITIDGSFSDWAGVPLAYRDSAGTPTGADFAEVRVANDELYLYLRFSLHTPNSPFTSHNNIFIDTDNSPATGFHPLGLAYGSEVLIQSGVGYQEKGGGFNEGAVNGLEWSATPTENATDFEIRIARAATYAADNQPVFTGDTIALLLEAENSSFVAVDLAPDAGDRLEYTFASAPEPFVGRVQLVSLTTSPWQVNASGTDLGAAWSEPASDDTGNGWTTGSGLFGYSATPGVYPAAIATSLPPGRPTAYFRTRFNWANDPAGVVLVASNYLSDGAVVYLNGIEAKRLRLPAGPVGFNTPATGGPPTPGAVELFGLPASSLVVGENVLAVELHQTAGDTTDFVLGLSLTAASQFPVIFTDPAQPADRSIVAGQSTTFAAEFVGSSPLTFQWTKDGQPIDGANAATLTINPVLAADQGSYQLKISNPLSPNVTSRAAVLSVLATPVTIADATQPADQTVSEGASATFSVSASGSAPLTYQWFHGTTPIPDATNATFVIAAARAADAGDYHAVVSNPLPSSATSRTARLTVTIDRTPPVITRVEAAATHIAVTFSEPVDATSAAQTDNYHLGGGLQVVSAAPNSENPAEVILTTTAQTFGVRQCLTVSGVSDLFNNPIVAGTTVAFVSTIAIDGSFDDWAAVPLAYADAVDSTTASDYQSIFITNDARYIFIRVQLHAPSDLAIFYNNIFVDGDNSSSGYPFRIGSEMLIQGGAGYQQKNGTFNEGAINGLDWAIQPGGVGADFEFRISRNATYASDGLPVFTAPAIGLVFDAENTSFQTVDTAPDSGGLLYTLSDVPGETLGRLQMAKDAFGEVTVRWSGAGILQSRASLTEGQWTNVDPTDPNAYFVGTPTGQAFFRLVLDCP